MPQGRYADKLLVDGPWSACSNQRPEGVHVDPARAAGAAAEGGAMTKEVADLVDAAIPAAIGLIVLSVPRAFLKRDLAEHERDARLHRLRLIGGLLVTVGAAMVGMQLLH
jgi:hypothetical protein